MHRSRGFAQRLVVQSQSWSVLKSQVTCASSLKIQPIGQVRYKKTVSENPSTSSDVPLVSSPTPPTALIEVPRLNKRNVVEDLEKLRNFTSTERNFITPLRAMQEYLLQPHDLTGLRKTLRRSPHVDEPPIQVFWRRDVEAR